jgi:membrane protein YqaA with SNARE-associated domain
LKHLWAEVMAKWKLVILPALLKVGIWGLGAVAVLDSSSIPVPMDPILAVYVWNNKGHWWLYCLMAAAGSAIGGLLPYWLGRACGELFLRKRVDQARFDQLRHRFERQEFLAVVIPSMMPPPFPWKVFIFASGVFEMRVLDFLIAVTVGRFIRWTVLSLLVIKLGPGAVELVAHHAGPVVLAVLLLTGIGFGLWWARRKRTASLAQS